MRTREEIEADARSGRFQGAGLSLEVLLDIRDLLTPLPGSIGEERRKEAAQ